MKKSKKHVFIGILFCAEKEPSEQTIGALAEVLRDLEHVDASSITIGTMSDQEILTALKEKMTSKEKDSLYSFSILVKLNALYLDLPEYMRGSKIPQQVYEGYYLHEVDTRKNDALKLKVIAAGEKLRSINQEIEVFPVEWLNAIKHLSDEWTKEKC